MKLFKTKNKTFIIKKDLLERIGGPGGYWNSKIPIDTIMVKAGIIYDVLELESLYFISSDNEFQIERACLSSRQIVTMNASILRAMDENIHAAFHELVDFIHNYGKGLEQPVSNLERYCIYQMLECIFYLVSKNK